MGTNFKPEVSDDCMFEAKPIGDGVISFCKGITKKFPKAIFGDNVEDIIAFVIAHEATHFLINTDNSDTARIAKNSLMKNLIEFSWMRRSNLMILSLQQ